MFCGEIGIKILLVFYFAQPWQVNCLSKHAGLEHLLSCWVGDGENIVNMFKLFSFILGMTCFKDYYLWIDIVLSELTLKRNNSDYVVMCVHLIWVHDLNALNSFIGTLQPKLILREHYFRKTSTEEKRKLGAALTRLSAEDLSKALEIVAQSNPSFQATAEEVHLDIDAQVIIVYILLWEVGWFFFVTNNTVDLSGDVLFMQRESTLWRLKFFVKDALEIQGKSSASMGGNNTATTTNNNHPTTNNNNKRKKEICDAIAKTAKKKNKKLPLD